MPDDLAGKEYLWQFLVKEYEITESKWRFLQGLRYAVFGGVAATHGALVAQYSNTLDAFQNSSSSHGLGRSALIFIPLVAIALVRVGIRLEQRLRHMYSDCSDRGVAIEKRFGIHDGVFVTLGQTPRQYPITHTQAIQLFAILLTSMWMFLFFFAFWTKEGMVS